MTAISLGFEFAQAGFLRFHAKIEGESTGVVARHWFSLTDQGLLVHAEKPALIDLTGGFFALGMFQSVEATEDTPHFILSSKVRNIDVFLSADTLEERSRWVEALRKAIPKARKKIKASERSYSPSPRIDPEMSPSGISTKAKRMLSSELMRASSPKTSPNGPTIVYSATIKVSEAKINGTAEPDTFILLNVNANHFRTRTVLKKANPLWSEDVTLRFKDPVSSTLRVSLWDEHGNKENILGKVDISLASIVPNAAAIQEWYPLTYATNSAYVSGEIHVRVDSTQKEDNGILFVSVIEGRNLPLRTRGSTETFVRVNMGKQSVKTKVHRTLDKSANSKAICAEAEWNETLELKTTDGIGDIVVSIFKQSGLSSTCVGQITIPPFSLPPMYEAWRELEVDSESIDKESSKAATRDSIGDIRLSLQVTRSIVYSLEYYDPLLSLLMEEETVANLVGVFDNTTLKPEDRVNVALRLVNIYEAKNRAPAILKALLTREIQAAPDVETLFRANSLASKAVDMYMKICGHRYLQYCIQDTIDVIYKDAGKRCCEIDPAKMDKTDDVKKNWKFLTKTMDDLLDRVFNSVEQCPSGMIQIFTHLQSEVEKKFADQNVRFTGVSSFLFLRFIVAAILGPKLFDLAPDHPSPKVAANLTSVARIVQRIANMTPMDFAAKDYLREREFYIEKQKRPMQVFIDTLCKSTFVPDFDPAAVDLQQELAHIQAHCENQIDSILKTLEDEQMPTARSASRLLVCLDAMAAKGVKPRKPTMLRDGEKWSRNPDFDCEKDRFNLDAMDDSGTSDSSSEFTSTASSSGPIPKSPGSDGKSEIRTKKSARGSGEVTKPHRSNSLAVPPTATDLAEPKRKSKLERML